MPKAGLWLVLLSAGLCALLTAGALPAGEGVRSSPLVEWAAEDTVLIAANGLLARFDLNAEKEELLDDTAIAFALSPPDASGRRRLAVAGPDEVALRSYPDFIWQAALPLSQPEAGKPESSKLEGGKPESALPTSGAADTVQALAWSPAPLTAGRDAATLAGGTANGHILLWDMTPPESAAGELWADLEIEPASPVARLSFSADGKRLLGVFEDGRAVLWDIEQRTELARFGPAPTLRGQGEGQLPPDTVAMVLSPDGGRVLVSHARGEQAEMSLLAESGEVLWRRAGFGAEFTADGGAVLALVPPYRIAGLYRTSDAAAVRVFEPPEGVKALYAVRVNPEGTRLVGVGEDLAGQVLIVWDFATARVLKTRR